MPLTRHDPWIFLAAGGVALGLILWKRQDEPTTSTTAAPSPSPRMRSFGEAIARAEGFFVRGSVPDRANNPGDLKLGGTTINGITVYPSAAEGWAALYRQLGLIATGRSKYYKPTMTIRQMGDVWAPGSENAPGIWAANVAKLLGVSVDTPVNQWLA